MRKGKGQYSNPDKKNYIPEVNIPDQVRVEDKTIYLLTDIPGMEHLPRTLIEPLAGKKERAWFTEHFYFCLPLTFGNQHGFLVKLLYDVVVRWDGREDNSAVSVHKLCPESIKEHQVVKSHFGSGIVTIQNRWTFRTPPGVNLIVGAPPNFILEAITPMFAVVQTDQLRRDFTFNLKINIPHRDIFLPRGTPIGWVLPYPRENINEYQLKLHPDGEVLEAERETMRHFGVARRDYENGLPGHHYRKGIDIYGNKFKEHERVIPGQSSSEWRGDNTFPKFSLENLSPTSASDETLNLLDEERQLLNKVLEKLRSNSPATNFNHVFQVYLFIQSARLVDNSEEEIKARLIAGGWSKSLTDILFEYI